MPRWESTAVDFPVTIVQLVPWVSLQSLNLLGLGFITRMRALGSERRPESRPEQSKARVTFQLSAVLDSRIGAIGE